MMTERKTTLSARNELARCRTELAAAQKEIAALKAEIGAAGTSFDKLLPERVTKPRTRQRASLQGEVLMGAKAIADKFGFTRRQVYHFMEQAGLPHFHIGRVVCARPAKIREWLANLETVEGSR